MARIGIELLALVEVCSFWSIRNLLEYFFLFSIALNTTFTPFCDFESENICGWFHDTEDDFDFTRANGHNNRTVRILTGPQADHTIGKPLEGHYMVINTKSQSYMKKARLISPVFNASWSHDTCLRLEN